MTRILLTLLLAATMFTTWAEPVRVVSYNIRYGTASDGPNAWRLRRDKVFAALREEQPDVAGLQEALRFQLDEIQAAVPGYALLGGGRDDGKTRGEYSPLLVATSRFEVVSSRTDWHSDTPDVPGSTSWGNTLPRICTSAVLRDRRDQRILHVLNTHFDHQSAPSRLKSAETLAARIRALDPETPVVLTGDFNATPDSPPLRTLLAPRVDGGAGLLDAVAAVEPTLATFGTFHNWSDRTDGPRIDFILVHPRGHLIAARVRPDQGPPYASDHRLVAVEWEFRP